MPVTAPMLQPKVDQVWWIPLKVIQIVDHEARPLLRSPVRP